MNASHWTGYLTRVKGGGIPLNKVLSKNSKTIAMEAISASYRWSWLYRLHSEIFDVRLFAVYCQHHRRRSCEVFTQAVHSNLFSTEHQPHHFFIFYHLQECYGVPDGNYLIVNIKAS
jgi:hypothetical protein